MDIGPPELLIILVIVLLLFGTKKLPELARSLGSAKKEFEKGIHDDKPAAAPAPPPASGADASGTASPPSS